MTSNESLKLSIQFKELLQQDLLHVFSEHLPIKIIEEQADKVMVSSRQRIFTPCNTILTMLVSAVQEDKSLQNACNIFKEVFERRNKELVDAEAAILLQKRHDQSQVKRKKGRPRKHNTQIRKCQQKPVSNSTAGYATARKKMDKSIFEAVFEYSTDFGNLEKESWNGLKTFITDGTYLQLQDTEEIREDYAVKGMEESCPQALLQVLIRQGSGQISQVAMDSRHVSELRLVIAMIKKLEADSLLLADDLYNAYYHFCLILLQRCHITVPGKRDRKYKVIRNISDNDQIVEISKTACPDYVTEEEWDSLPESILLRRISYTYPTKNGVEPAILYTTILDEKINAVDIVAKYVFRWDIEITIREIKTLMDINVLRSKTPDMMEKEFLIALAAYNMVRKIIAQSADKVGFSPQKDIFQKCSPFGRTILLDKKGRVYFKFSPERYGYANGTNK
jgi:hypothetical protein